ncbi:MAG: DUF3810 domain-containing protein [Candidatus Aminicenantales bacterium]
MPGNFKTNHRSQERSGKFDLKRNPIKQNNRTVTERAQEKTTFFRREIWIGLGAGAYAVHLWLGRDSRLAEKFYSRGIYVGIRRIWDNTLGFSPIPLLYVILFAAVVWVSCRIALFFFRKKSDHSLSFPRKIGRALLRVASWIGFLLFFFYILWGFNYNRIGLEQQMKLETEPLSLTTLAEEADWATRMTAEARASIPGSSAAALGAEFYPKNIESILRLSLTGILERMGYPAPGRVRIRLFQPGGWLMRFSSSGIFVPFFGEGYIAGNLLPFEMPFTMAHEMAHGYGICEEGAANFLAFLTCESSAIPAIRYSGFLSYWSVLFAETRRLGPEAIKTLREKIPDGMKADLRAEGENWRHFQGPLRRIGETINQNYLKSQGIQEGIRSYDRMVLLVAAWKKAAR